MIIVFYDVVAPSLYTYLTLNQTGLGGTEATILRVSHALRSQHTVYIAQRGRAPSEEVMVDDVHYVSFETANQLSPDVVVLLREYSWVEKIGQLFPHARRLFWLHNMPSHSLYHVRQSLLNYQFEIIAVSHFHAAKIKKRLRGKWYQRALGLNRGYDSIPVHVLYNPIDDQLNPTNIPWRTDQLFLASTPYKGLDQTLKMFAAIRKTFPEYRLVIATYSAWDTSIELPPQVQFLGSLSHPELMQRIRESFCVFYPQTRRCETFGLVYAESNAVGTPVLAHDFGSAREVLSNPDQLVNGHDVKSVLNKMIEWRNKRPMVRANPEFRLSKVAEQWLKLLLVKD